MIKSLWLIYRTNSSQTLLLIANRDRVTKKSLVKDRMILPRESKKFFVCFTICNSAGGGFHQIVDVLCFFNVILIQYSKKVIKTLGR